jgi:hypothetical protein
MPRGASGPAAKVPARALCSGEGASSRAPGRRPDGSRAQGWSGRRFSGRRGDGRSPARGGTRRRCGPGARPGRPVQLREGNRSPQSARRTPAVQPVPRPDGRQAPDSLPHRGGVPSCGHGDGEGDGPARRLGAHERAIAHIAPVQSEDGCVPRAGQDTVAMSDLHENEDQAGGGRRPPEFLGAANWHMPTGC